jgi:hypothetical protein
MSPNRIVAILTPVLFAPLAGGIATWIAKNIPGAEVSQNSLEEVFIGGALIALAPAAQWLHGWQKYEARQADRETAIELANVAAPPAPTFTEQFDFEAEQDFEGLEDLDDLDEVEDFDEVEGFDEFEDELAADEQPVSSGS